MSNDKAQPGKAQIQRGGTHEATVQAMANEALVVHVQDPEKAKVLLVNDIRESRYARVISVGQPTGRHREAPIKVGEIVVTKTATAGVAVPGVYVDNKPVHRLDWNDIIAVAEEYTHE